MSPDRALLTFRVGNRRLALAASEVAEVVRPPRLTRVPHAPPALAGVAGLRGGVLPVVALDLILGDAVGASEQAGHSHDGRVVVLNRTPVLGLAVDEVTGLTTGAADPGALVLLEAGDTRVLALDGLIDAQFPGRGRSRSGHSAGDAPRAQEASAEAWDVALLGFQLAGQAYALPLEHAREVLALPAEIAALPRTDAAMLGVAELRGALLPLVSASVLLGLSQAALDTGSRVIVTALGDARIGLVVDALTAILRVPSQALGPVPRVLNRGVGEASVDAMLRLPDGGLVSVLAPERLFRDESVAQILEDGRRAKAMETRTSSTPVRTQRFLIFKLADESYAIPVDAVQEVVRQPDSLTRLPRAPSYVLGVMNLRGVVTPVIAQRQRFGVDGTPQGRSRVMICRLGELVVGFAVDAVTEILEVPEEQLGPAPELGAGDAVFDRVAQIEADGRLILVVAPQALLERAEADLLRDLVREAPGHS